MDVTITQPDGTAIHMVGEVDDIIAVLRTFLGYENAPNTLPSKISEALDKILTDLKERSRDRTVAQACNDADDLNDSQQPWGIVRSDYVGTMTVHNTKCPAYSELAHRLNATYVSRQDALWTIRTGWPSYTEGNCSSCGTDDTRTINQQPEIGHWSAFTRTGNTFIHRAGCDCEPEGRIFHTEIGVTLAAFSLTIHNEGPPGIINMADCCY